RSIRKWFQALGPTERKHVLNKLRRYWYIPIGLVATLGASGVVYYTTHLEDTPITGRRRFIALTHDQIMKISQAEARMVSPFLSIFLLLGIVSCFDFSDFVQILLKRVFSLRLLFFSFFFSFQSGDMFVFNGILELANTQDQLAIILGHEMAHAVLEHGVEELSLASLVDIVVIFCLAALWCIIPSDGIAIITHWFYNKVIQLLTHMPHSRTIEREADHVGLMFAAKACFDVRAGSLLWKKMSLMERVSTDGDETLPLPEFMSTHPDSLKRAEHLDFLLPEAETWRNNMSCPKLPKDDPRQAIKVLSDHVNNQIAAKKVGQNLQRVAVQQVS
ncbi:hypothetical protein EGW08_020759, partial [Elysia chlorotica]